MKTLYLRNVPDDVAARLEALAGREALSVSAFAVRELTETSRRADNAALLNGLPDLQISSADVLGALDAERDDRP